MKRTSLSVIIALTLLMTSCQETQEDVTPSENQNTTSEAQMVEDKPVQSNVVTPEFWENFDTDVRVVFFYSKKESSPEYIHKIKDEIIAGAEANGYVFHEYHTDENMGMVQVDDEVFFNLTEYLWNSDEGFVLLRQGALQHVPAAELSEEGIGSIVADFFI